MVEYVVKYRDKKFRGTNEPWITNFTGSYIDAMNQAEEFDTHESKKDNFDCIVEKITTEIIRAAGYQTIL